MYIYQDGKLYIQDGEQLVGVEIYSDKVVLVEGENTTLSKECKILTAYEVQCKFHIQQTPYIFPRGDKETAKEVIVDDTDIKVKTRTRKPRVTK